MRALLISTNAIGDTYIACSAIQEIKQTYPDALIDIVAAESSRFFLEKLNFSNLFLIKKKSFSEVMKALRPIRSINYDLVFNFFPGRVNSIFFQLSKAKQKAGFRNFSKKLDWHDSDDEVISIPNKQGIRSKWKSADNFLKRISLPLEAAGIRADKLQKPVFEIQSKEDKKFDIIFHLFSSDSRKSIPDKKIAAILDFFSRDLSKNICLIGDKAEIQKIKKPARFGSNIFFIENPEIETIVYLLKNSSLFAGVDSFPLHLADAHSIKTLGIFTCTNENSVFQSLNHKFVFRISNMDEFQVNNLIQFMKLNKLI